MSARKIAGNIRFISIPIAVALQAICQFCSALADDLGNGPSLRQMIGQMVMIGFTGAAANSEGYRLALAQAGNGKIGGVIYLRRNIADLASVRQLNAGLQASSDLPLFIAVDQEGGRIERLTEDLGFPHVPSAAEIAATMSLDQARARYDKVACGLSELGFNVNLGPVVDLNINPQNPIIGKLGRSYSSDPEIVSAYARTFILAHRAAGVLTTLKHFPGHGSSRADSHRGEADVTATWRQVELAPFRSLINTGDAGMIMISHVVNTKLSGELATPSTLSPAIVAGLLRTKLNFQGVVITDDLQMNAIATSWRLPEVIERTVRAGNDILLFANDRHADPLIPDKVADILVAEASKDPEILSRIRTSYNRITHLKAALMRHQPKPSAADFVWLGAFAENYLAPWQALTAPPHSSWPALYKTVGIIFSRAWDVGKLTLLNANFKRLLAKFTIPRGPSCLTAAQGDFPVHVLQ